MERQSHWNQAHWNNVYATKAETSVSWFQDQPEPSLTLIRATGVGPKAALIDIGGGASRLVDALLAEGFENLSVLDLSQAALDAAKARLGPAASTIRWIAADVTDWEPSSAYDLWHDRAAFHFLTEPQERAAYRARLMRALRVGGHAIIGTFAPDGPERCSGLPVMRQDAAAIGAFLGEGFELIDERRHDHQTPAGALQRFQFSTFRRAG